MKTMKNTIDKVLWISSVIIWFWLAVFVYYSDLISEILWIFILFPLAFFAIAILINTFLIFWATVKQLRSKNSISTSLLLLLLNIFIPVVLVISPLPNLYRTNIFQYFKSEREVIVDKIVNKQYETDYFGKVYIPESDWGVATDVLFVESEEGNFVLFYYLRGIPDGYSVYVYSVEDVVPRAEDFPEHVTRIEKIEDNWYWVEAD